MPSATYHLIKQYYDAFNANDMTTFVNLLTDDVAHDINQGGCEVGKEKFAKFIDMMQKHYAEQVSDLIIFASEDGKRAAAEFVINGKYLVTAEGLPPAKGQTYRLPVGAFFAIRDGKISRVTNYYNLQDWIEQVSV